MVGPTESSRSPRLPAPEIREPAWLLPLRWVSIPYSQVLLTSHRLRAALSGVHRPALSPGYQGPGMLPGSGEMFTNKEGACAAT